MDGRQEILRVVQDIIPFEIPDLKVKRRRWTREEIGKEEVEVSEMEEEEKKEEENKEEENKEEEKRGGGEALHLKQTCPWFHKLSSWRYFLRVLQSLPGCCYFHS